MTEENMEGLRKHNMELNKLMKDSLSRALIILMKEKPFNKISVTEICEKAGVSRMAYYNNFKCKEDMLTYLVHNLNLVVFEKIGSPFRPTTRREWYVFLFEQVRENKDLLLTIFNAGFRHKYLSIINDLVLHDKTIKSWDKYKRLIWAGGIVNTMICWLENGMQETIDDLATFCHKNLTI